MNPERLRQIEELYHAAREHAPGERELFLREICVGDEELEGEVRSLLAQESSGFMARPVLEAAASLVVDLRPGTKLGPYEIVRRLGEGGMGDVYQARDTRLGRVVAIKTAHEEFSGRFQGEARAISALNHSNICTLYDVGPNYLVMELVEGETLAARLEKGRLPMELTLRYGAQIADALTAAHAKGIIHRDLKPSNIMIAKAGIKVLDFGLAKFAPTAGRSDDTLTESGAIIGTPAYMAPEQLEGKEADGRTDIFALGLVLFEMATGHKAFRGESRAALIAETMRCEPPIDDLSPPHFAHVVERCLARDRDNRWQTARDVKLELEFQPRMKAVEWPSPRRRRLLWSAAVATILGGLALGAWYLGSGGGDPIVEPLTTEPGLQGWPSFSPDGTRVAYSWNGASPDNFDIWVRQIGPGNPQRLTKDPEWDATPRWSPDGKWIAFLRRQANNTTGVWAVPALGGQERKLGDADSDISANWWAQGHTLDWSPDGRWLLITKRPAIERRRGLALLSFDTGEIRQLTDPHPQANSGGQFAPHGHAVAFLRERGGQFGLMLLTLSGSWEPNGQPREITFRPDQNVRNYSWGADSSNLIVSVGDVEASNLWRIPISGGAARILHFAGAGAAFPAVASRGDRMVFSRDMWEQNIRSLELDAAGQAVGPAEKAFDSTSSEYCPRFSPDGTRVAFESSRSGGGVRAIWTCSSDGSNCAQLTPAGGPHAGSPSWSPDGKWIAYDVRRQEGTSLYVINSGGGTPRLLIRAKPELIYNAANWSANGQWIYYHSFFNGSAEIWRIPAAGGEAHLVVAGVEARESPDGKWVYYSGQGNNQPTSLRRIPVGGGASTEVLPHVSGRNFEVLDTGIWFLTPNSPEGSQLQFYDFASKSTRTVYRTNRPVFVGLTVSSDRRRILFTQSDQPASRNLMLVENFR